MSMYWFLFPVNSRSYYGPYLYHIFFYLPMFCTFPVVIFVCRNIASYLPEFRSPQRVQCTVCIICSAFFISFGLMLYCLVVRVSVSHATGPGSYSALCVIICLVLLDFSGKWTVKYITLRYWTFAVFLLEKRHWKIPVHLPFALLPYGLFAGIIR